MSWDPLNRGFSGLVAPIYIPRDMDVEIATASAPAAASMDAKSALRSCTTCSKAKAKCVRLPGEAVCERCARLRKECHSREPVIRRRKVVKTTRAAQLEKLESKIEHLVNALATTQSQRGFSIDLGQPSPPISQTSDRGYGDQQPLESNHRLLESDAPRQRAVLESLCDDMDESCASASDSGSSTSPAATNSPGQTNSAVVPYADYSSVGVPLAEAEILLDRYRRLMSPALPFVILPPNATASQLFAEKPALLHAIVVVSGFHDLAAQQSNVKRLLRNLSERIMINCEKSVDILQAILVFVGWYHPHIFWSQQCTNLLHLAIAMIIDLGFDRPAQNCGDWKKGISRAVNRPNSTPEQTPVPEEHRILAGTFYLTSILSSSFKKIDAMPWTEYLNNALKFFEENPEYDSDLLLVQLVRLQHLVEETSLLPTARGQVHMYIRSFISDLASLRKNDPTKETSMFLQLQYLTTEILIWELSLNDLLDNKDSNLRCHIDDIGQLINAIKRFTDLFFTLPVSAYLTMPFSMFAQFAHAFVVLIKVASLEVEGWDPRLLNDRLDFLETVETAAGKFESSVTSHPDGIQIQNDHFAKWAIRIRWMKQVYEAKFVEGEGDDKTDALKAQFRTPASENQQVSSAVDTPVTMTPHGGQQQPTPPDDVLSGDFFNYLDENFWQSFAGDFDLGYPDVNMV